MKPCWPAFFAGTVLTLAAVVLAVIYTGRKL